MQDSQEQHVKNDSNLRSGWGFVAGLVLTPVATYAYIKGLELEIPRGLYENTYVLTEMGFLAAYAAYKEGFFAPRRKDKSLETKRDSIRDLDMK